MREGVFTIALNRQQYERKRARHFLDSYFDGSLNQFMSALNGGEKICCDATEEL
ncbi:MAG: hypothetical protein NC489_30845 [Ruminococcus flavefaciens]|nr:hypothetical protein [Eubacterium sp.]MCM1234521.1 hypothetical protein [Ruminococcus flavefaciens]